VFSIWLTLLAGITLPAWYWAPAGNAGLGYVTATRVHGAVLGYFPHGPSGAYGTRLPSLTSDLARRSRPAIIT
jgi:hypothetical protein